jgi:hypothetical protein
MSQHQEGIVAALRRRGGLLLLLSLLVALGVTGMHQLSDGHMLVTTTAPANHHGHAALPSTARHIHPESDAGEPIAGTLRVTTGWVLSASGDTCPDCNWHAMAEACLLTLGLITALTTARSSASRPVPTVPPPLAPRQPCTPDHRVRMAMSLSELSIRRT